MNKTLKVIALVSLLVACVGCTMLVTTDYQPYEGKDSIYSGNGGTKVVIDGIELWANGSPPRKFKVLGVVTNEVGAGFGDESLIRSVVASEVRKQGGNAAVQLTNNTAFSGMVINTMPGVYVAASVKKMQFTIVTYVD